ncbi:E3 ubiquitin-protein ligase mib1-like [Saccostrea echinata]|uniref:E3 ubiquitin-protein ligase mib1-like n=1 Tax=Saccostrea echinata TaxID=191078 RepID=UPI002A7F574B|nr:E3 ubiquitin-protein ligase mib1-like [Saccostrea echinata]
MAGLLKSDAAQEVFQEGFKPRIIARAAERILRKTGDEDLSKDDILKEIEKMIKNGEIKEDSCKIPPLCQIDDILNKNSTSDPQKLQEEVSQSKRRLYCCVCNDRKSEYIFKGCGHLVCQICCPRRYGLCRVCGHQIVECYSIKFTKISDLKNDE